MNKFTPGPWRVNKSNGMRIAAGRNTPIAETLGAHLLEEEHANARLIAAAPELLASLKTIADWRELTHSHDLPEIVLWLEVEARAAIAKAEGE